MPVADVATRSLKTIREDHRLWADFQFREIPNLEEASAERFRNYWLKWPLEHLSNKPGKSLFEHEPGDNGGMMVPTFSVSDERQEAFVELAFEILDWRLQDYLLARLTVLEPSVLPVSGGSIVGHEMPEEEGQEEAG